MRYLVLIWTIGLAACGAPGDMAAFQPGETGRVVRVIDGDALVLDTGQSVRLVSIEAPSPERGERPAAPFAEHSSRILEDMVLGRRVQLHYSGLTRDRYDRALAHVETIDRLGPHLWVNLELVRAGAVRVRLYPDTAAGAQPLFAAEQAARTARDGLWAGSAYAIIDARDAARLPAGFTILSGVLGPRAPTEYEGATCHRDLMASPVRLTVEASAMAVCDLDIGLRVEVRGWLRDGAMSINAAGNVQVQGSEPVAMAGE